MHLHPDFAPRVWQSEGCAELVLNGSRLVAIRRRLLARARKLGHRLTGSPALAVMANGRRLPAVSRGAEWRVELPAGTDTVTLRSRDWVPAETVADANDCRRLGIAVAGLLLDGQPVPLDDARLLDGWHAPERHGRWTDGAARIAIAGARTLGFSVALRGRYWLGSDAGAGRLIA